MSAVDQAVEYARALIARAQANPMSVTWDDMQQYRALEGAARQQASYDGGYSGTGVLPFIQFNDLLQAVNRYRDEPLRSPPSQDRLDYRRDPNNWPTPAQDPAPTEPPPSLLPPPTGPYDGMGPNPPSDYVPPPSAPYLPPMTGPNIPPPTTLPSDPRGLPLPPGSGSLPPGGQQGGSNPLASYGLMRGPNGEILPVMLNQGQSPFAPPSSQPLIPPGGFSQSPVQMPRFVYDPTLGRFVPAPTTPPANTAPPQAQPPPVLPPPDGGNTGGGSGGGSGPLPGLPGVTLPYPDWGVTDPAPYPVRPKANLAGLKGLLS